MTKRKTKTKPKTPRAVIRDADTLSMYKSDFYQYGMAVIENRAIPDIRDGLKPVHRAIIFEMLSTGATSKKKPVKVAKITGAVIGNWHPHGDAAVEDALVGLAVPWKNTMPPVKVEGNQGSIMGDPAAAGRYIEARLTAAGDAYGHKLKKGIVPYVDNFDNTSMMPEILPAQLPYLLINGISDGIAVGVASTMPPHNPHEALAMTIQYMQKPKTKLEDLLEIMPGPDFPSGATIINSEDLLEIYKTGNGIIRVKATMEYIKDEHTLRVTEVPYSYSGSVDTLVAGLIKATNETRNRANKVVPAKVEGVKNIEDFSGRDGLDVSIELMPGADPEVVTQNLYAYTGLESSVTFNFNALNNKILNRYSLRSYLAEYTDFQHEIVKNEHQLEKESLERQIEILVGRIVAIKLIDEIVDVVKHSNGRLQVMDVLMNGTILDGTQKKYHKMVSTFRFTEIQADTIARLPLYQLNRLDRDKLVADKEDLEKRLAEVTRIVEDRPTRHRLIIKRHKDELKLLPPQPRMTQITSQPRATSVRIDVPKMPMFVGLDKYGYIRIETRAFEGAVESDNKSRAGLFDESGNCWNIHMDTVKPTKDRGTLSSQMFDTTERIVGIVTPINEDTTAQALFIYTDGSLKITDASQFMTKTRSTKVNTRQKSKMLKEVVMIPEGVNMVNVNNKDIRLDDIPHQGISGGGRVILKPTPDTPLTITFRKAHISPKKQTKVQTPSDVFDAVVVFDGSDKCYFDWSTVDTNGVEGLYVTTYQELLKSTLVFVHKDGTAKRVDGSQFEVKTKRTSIQANKNGVESIYIDKAHNKTLIGTYAGGESKRIDETKISSQSKVGGGVRVFMSPKHEFQSVHIDEKSKLPIVSFATQPK